MRAMGERDAGIRRRGEGGGDAGDDFKLDAGRDQRFGLFATAAENKRVAALEADDVFAFAGEPDQRALDVALGAAEAAAFLADKHLFCLWSGQGQNRWRGQIVVDHRVGLADQPRGFDREKLWVAGPGADEEDFARFNHCSSAKAARVPIWGGRDKVADTREVVVKHDIFTQYDLF